MRGLAKTVEQVAYCDKLADLIDKFCLRKLSDLPQATMQLTLGRFQTSPFSEEDMEKLRQEWFKLLPDPGKAQVVPPDQPFLLHALAQSLRLMGDPDVEAIDGEGGSNFVDGVHLGHIHPLGPTLHHRSSGLGYRSQPTTNPTGPLTWTNYFRGSEEEYEKVLEKQFREEESEGRMKPVSEKEARKKYPGSSLRIAAQGILDKPDGGHRIIHDGTHGVHLNNEIRIEDRLENPGPRELACIMETSVAAGERVVFAVNGDIAKAHRRVRVKEEDWGAQACKTSRSSNVVWLNKVGTFGVASAAFWWSRLMGLLGRHALNLSRNDWVFVLTFVDDLHIAAGGTNRWLAIWRFIVALELVEAPFSYKKFRGGFSLDYVGYWMDYSRFQLGLSEKRTTWLIGFIDQMEADGWLVLTRRFQEFHGRLGFTAQVLPWLRPLMAPGYSWLAAVGRNSTLKLPELLAIVRAFIRRKFQSGLRKVSCVQEEISLGEVFRTDAKCEDGRVVLGGWLTLNGTRAKEAPWFSIEVTPQQAPWLFKGETHQSSWPNSWRRSLHSDFWTREISGSWSQGTRAEVWRRHGQPSHWAAGSKTYEHQDAPHADPYGLLGLLRGEGHQVSIGLATSGGQH